MGTIHLLPFDRQLETKMIQKTRVGPTFDDHGQGLGSGLGSGSGSGSGLGLGLW